MIKKVLKIFTVLLVSYQFNFKEAKAQNFQIAINQYIAEFQTPYFEGQEITPMWFEIESGPWIDVDGDGIGDIRYRRNAFRIFGRIIWRGDGWYEDKNGNQI